jgi:hypothetical protein
MSVATLLDKPVTLVVKTGGGFDDYGQPIWETTLVPASCYYQFVATDEVDSASRQDMDYRVFLPVDTDMTGLEAVDINAERYDVQGVPHLQWNPRLGKNEYWLVRVRRAAS